MTEENLPKEPLIAKTPLPQTGNGAEEKPGKDRNTIVIHLNKTYVLIALVAILSFVGGYFTHSLAAVPMIADTGGQAPGVITNPEVTEPQRIVVETDNDPSLGPPDAPVVIVEFSDYQCPFCKRFREQTLDPLLEAYDGKVRYVYRDFPISSIHPFAQKAAEASECANEQGQFWSMHDLLFSKQDSWSTAAQDPDEVFKSYAVELKLDTNRFNDCLDQAKYAREVLEDLDNGISYGINGTPTFFINGIVISGAQPLSVFQAVIDEELASAEK